MWPPYPLLLVMIFYIFLLFKVLEKKESYYSFLLGLTVGLTFHFEVAFGAFLLPATAVILLFFHSRLTLRSAISGCFGVVINFLPQIIFDLRHDFIQTRGIINFLTGRTRQDIGIPKSPSLYLKQHLFMLGSVCSAIRMAETISGASMPWQL